MVKNRPANAGDTGDLGFDPWVGKILWRRKWQPAAVFLAGKSQGQRSLSGGSSWGLKGVGHNSVTKQQQRSLVLVSILVEAVKHFMPTHQLVH